MFIAICMSLMKYLFRHLACFLNLLLISYCWVLRVVYFVVYMMWTGVFWHLSYSVFSELPRSVPWHLSSIWGNSQPLFKNTPSAAPFSLSLFLQGFHSPVRARAFDVILPLLDALFLLLLFLILLSLLFVFQSGWFLSPCPQFHRLSLGLRQVH